MPNWSFNVVRIIGEHEELEKMIPELKITENPFDFNTILKMPDELHNDPPVRTDLIEHQIAYYCKKENQPIPYCRSLPYHIATDNLAKAAELAPHENAVDVYDAGKKWFTRYQKYGHLTWYDWAVENWGTKWNSYNTYGPYWESDNVMVYTFDTAWTAPLPVIVALSYQHPSIVIEFEVSYEGGELADRYTFIGGDMLSRQEQVGDTYIIDPKTGIKYPNWDVVPSSVDAIEECDWTERETYDVSAYCKKLEESA